MPATPIAALLNAALSDPGPLDPTILAVAVDTWRADPASVRAPALYTRPELDAATAAQIAAERAAATDTAALWAALALLRPENAASLAPESVAAWDADTAGAVLTATETLPHRLPHAVALALTARPELGLAAQAAGRVPQTAEARAVVDLVGAAALAAWGPGTEPVPLAGTDATWQLVNTVAGWSSAAPLREHAANTWTCPTALACIRITALSQSAADRLTRASVLPAIPDVDAGGDDTHRAILCQRTQDLLPLASLPVRTALAAAWAVGPAQYLHDGEYDELALAFADAGTPLRTPVLTRPARGTASLDPDELRTVLAAVTARAAGRPQYWAALNAALAGGPQGGVTWTELLDALAGTLTPAGTGTGNP